ncbi:MAG: glycosyltransferase [Rubrobacteraceae bacterium]
MRIAFVADDLYPGFGGQAAASEGHIETLLELGHEVRVLAGAEESPAKPPPGVRVGRLPVWRPGDQQTQLALPRRRAINELLDWAEVAQVNTPTPLALRTLRLARRRGLPTVMGFHTQEESATLHFDKLRPLVTEGLRRWYGYLYHQPDCLAAPTAFAARIARRYTPRPVHVVSNGIRLPEPDPTGPRRISNLRDSLLSGRQFLLVYLSRLSEEKRPQDLLEIMSALAHLRKDARLVVAGDGPLRRKLERRTAELGMKGAVRFLGYVSGRDKQDLLTAGDLFLMPSPTELQSIATLEAMSRRCAVVALKADTSAVCEMVRNARCGVCYEIGQTNEAAKTIDGLLNQPNELRRLQTNAAKSALEHDVRESGRRLEEIYSSLLASRTKRDTGDYSKGFDYDRHSY